VEVVVEEVAVVDPVVLEVAVDASFGTPIAPDSAGVLAARPATMPKVAETPTPVATSRPPRATGRRRRTSDPRATPAMFWYRPIRVVSLSRRSPPSHPGAA